MSDPSQVNGRGRSGGSGSPPAGDGGPRPAPAAIIPFGLLLQAAGATSEDDLVAAIRSDAAALGEMGAAASVHRYAQAVDFAAHPRARAAAVDAQAQSLAKLEDMPPALARKIAEAEADALAERMPTTPRADAMHAAPHRTPRRRAAMSGPVAHIPWQSAAAVILALGLIATGAWAIVTTVRAERAEAWAREQQDRAERASADADAAYERGMTDKAAEMSEAEQNLQNRERDLRNELERERAEIERLTEEAQTKRDASEELWDDALTKVSAILDQIDTDMQDGYVQAAAEYFIPLEQIVNRAAVWDDSLLDEFSQARLETVIMPSLHLIYNTDLFGDGEYLDEVHDLLAQLEARRIEAARARLEPDGG
jgi:hypothetical protein